MGKIDLNVRDKESAGNKEKRSEEEEKWKVVKGNEENQYSCLGKMDKGKGV